MRYFSLLSFITYRDQTKPQNPCYNTVLQVSAQTVSFPHKALNYQLEQAITLPNFLFPYKMVATWAMQVGAAIFVHA